MRKTRILVVDDEPSLSDVVRRFLENTDRFEVWVENRASNALAAARRFLPDLVLLDAEMPGKDGGIIAREIEANSKLRGTPVLFLSSRISPEECEGREISRGGKRFVGKPVTPAILIAAVDRVLSDQSYRDIGTP